MRLSWAIWTAILAFALVAVAGVVSAEQSDPQIHPLTTADEGGEVPAGVPLTLGWVLTNGDGEPAFHQDAAFEVRFEGQTVLATTPASGHDYDGVDPYQVAFPKPGNYTVHATVHDNSAGELVEREVSYEGTVTPAPEDRLGLTLEVPDAVGTGQALDAVAHVTGPDGQPVEDAEVTFRVQRAFDAFEVLKTRTHDPDGSHELSYVPDRAGTFQVTAIATPIPGQTDLAATSVTHTVEVERSLSDPPTLPVPSDRPLENDRETGEEGEGYQLFGTYDPYTSVGPHTRLRLGMLTLDEDTGAPARDVRYEATILGPEGTQLFRSSSLSGVDGFEYVTVSREEPGTYRMRVDATKGSWSDDVTLEFTVLPPAGATNAGSLHATPNASTELEAGQASTFPIHVEDAAGVPLAHGEVDVRLVDADSGVPVYTGKLHSHENGTLPITMAAPAAGDYTLQVMPESLQPAPTPYTFGAEVGQPPVFDVSAEETVSDEVLEPQGDAERDEAPGLGLALVLATVSLAAASRARL